MTEMAILYDSSKCSACKGCQVQCKQWNMLPSSLGKDVYPFTGSLQAPMDLSGDTRIIMEFREKTGGKNGVEWAFTRRSCFHCTDPACANVCPTGAITKLEDGTVNLDAAKCTGCKYCTAACPFEVPKYRERFGVSNKCTLCNDRTAQGRSPACVQTCPAGALDYGPRADMIAKAKKRLEFLKGRGIDRAELYGETEMGGLHVLTIAKFGIEQHGLPRDPKPSGITQFMQVLKPITGIAAVGVVAGLGLSFLTGVGYKRDAESPDAASEGRQS